MKGSVKSHSIDGNFANSTDSVGDGPDDFIADGSDADGFEANGSDNAGFSFVVAIELDASPKIAAIETATAIAILIVQREHFVDRAMRVPTAAGRLLVPLGESL